MNKRWVLYNEFELNNESLKSVWMFYSLYDLSLAICKVQDENFILKNKLIYRYLRQQSKSVYSQIKKFMIKDVEVINRAMEIIENIEEGGLQKGDYKKPTMVAISIHE